jgi:hypothetical protein
LLVLLGLGPQLDLGQHLVGEARRHDEARVAGGVAEVQQTALGQQDHALAVGKLDHVDLGLDVGPLEVLQPGNVDLVVEVADVADDRHVLHLAHVLEADDVAVAGGGDEDVGVDTTSSSRTTSKPSMAACRAQIGSASVTLTRAPAPAARRPSPCRHRHSRR